MTELCSKLIKSCYELTELYIELTELCLPLSICRAEDECNIFGGHNYFYCDDINNFDFMAKRGL